MTATQNENHDNKQYDSPTCYFLVTPKNTHTCSTLRKSQLHCRTIMSNECVSLWISPPDLQWGPGEWQKLRTTVQSKKKRKMLKERSQRVKHHYIVLIQTMRPVWVFLKYTPWQRERQTLRLAIQLSNLNILNYTDVCEKKWPIPITILI